MTPVAALVYQLLGAYWFAIYLQENKYVKIYSLFCLIFKTLYTIQHRPTASNSKKNTANGMLEDIVAANATAANNIANFLLDGCEHTRAWADLQILGNLGSVNGPIYVVKRTSNPGSTKFFKLFEHVYNKSGRRQPKDTRIKLKIKTAAISPILGKKYEPWLHNGQSQKLLQHLKSVRSPSAWASLTTSSIAFTTTYTSAPDETLTKSIINKTITTPPSFDLLSLNFYWLFKVSLKLWIKFLQEFLL